MNTQKFNLPSEVQVGFGGYVALVLALIVFSGTVPMFAKFAGYTWLNIFDFQTLLGKFGTIAESKNIFKGVHGSGAREGFLMALSLMPTVMSALGVVAVVEGFGGLRAAQKLVTPLFRPLLGLPGICCLPFIASLQSVDVGAGMTRDLYESQEITDPERTVFTTLQFSGSALITNYFASGAIIFAWFTVPIILPLIVVCIGKVIGTNLMRLYFAFEMRRNEAVA